MTRTERVDARRRGVTTVRRATIAVALSAAAAISGITGAMAASWSAAHATATSSNGDGSGSAQTSEPDWGPSVAPGQSSGRHAQTSSGGS